MSLLAQQLIAENKAKHARGEDASYLDLGNCGLTSLPDISDMDWLETLVLSNTWWDLEQSHKRMESANAGPLNKIKDIPAGAIPGNLCVLIASRNYESQWTITSWDFLKGLTNLQVLNLRNYLAGHCSGK